MLLYSEFEVMHVDEFIDELLHAERVCDVILPRLQVGLTSSSIILWRSVRKFSEVKVLII